MAGRGIKQEERLSRLGTLYTRNTLPGGKWTIPWLIGVGIK